MLCDLEPFVIDCVNTLQLSPHLPPSHSHMSQTCQKKPSPCCFKSIPDGQAVTSAASTVKCAQTISRYVFLPCLWLMTASLSLIFTTTKPSFCQQQHNCLTFDFKCLCFSCSLTRNLWPWTRSLLLRTWCRWKRGGPAFRTSPTTPWTSGASWRTASAKSYPRSPCRLVFLPAVITTDDCKFVPVHSQTQPTMQPWHCRRRLCGSACFG